MAFALNKQASLPDFAHEDLIADRVHARKGIHFFEKAEYPEGVKPHPNPINLLAGCPNHGFFPIESIDVHLKKEPFSHSLGKTVVVPDVSTNESVLDLKTSLQYGDTNGQPSLRQKTHDFVRRVVRPKMNDWDIMMTIGGAVGVGQCFDTLVNPGETVLFEEFTFTAILNGCLERGGIPVPIKLNKVMENGTLGQMDYADELESMLSNWKEKYPKLPMPKCLYTIPNGHNPLGVALSLEQKQKIYSLAEKYNFFIIEDEPYAYLNFSSVEKEANYNLSNDEFIQSLHPSYTTIDRSGRVCRCETFSKIFAPGCRMGYVTAHPKFLAYMKTSSDANTRAPSGFSECIVNNTIDKLGGVEGYIHWITLIRNEYLKRKNIFVKALQNTEASKKGLLSPIDPDCGMFISCRINLPEDKRSDSVAIMKKYLMYCGVAGVIPVLGTNMAVDKHYSAKRGNFLRLAISFPDTADVLVESAGRLSEATINLFKNL